MWRLCGWLAIAALALCAHVFDSELCRALCAGAFFALLALQAPRALRSAVCLVGAFALALAMTRGLSALFDAIPALISALVAWLFARTLFRSRRPLIARAIAALDGAQQLDDPAVARYARRLTLLWALFQAFLALIAAALALASAQAIVLAPWLPGPRTFGAIVLPAAVLTLLCSEFIARRWLLPQAPRQRLFTFVRELVRAWPALLQD